MLNLLAIKSDKRGFRRRHKELFEAIRRPHRKHSFLLEFVAQ